MRIMSMAVLAGSIAVMTAVGLLTAGCEGDSGGSESDSAPVATNDAEAVTNDTEALPDPHFPDGLHPDDEGNQIIAGIFKDALAGAPAPDAALTDPNTVLCIGDSITENGYPPYLANMIPKTVINRAIGGTGTQSAANGIGALLLQYKPGYVLILDGANDVITHHPPDYIVDNLRSIIRSCRLAGSSPVVATLTPMSGPHANHREDVDAVNDAIRDLAGETGTPLADLAKAF